MQLGDILLTLNRLVILQCLLEVFDFLVDRSNQIVHLVLLRHEVVILVHGLVLQQAQACEHLLTMHLLEHINLLLDYVLRLLVIVVDPTGHLELVLNRVLLICLLLTGLF